MTWPGGPLIHIHCPIHCETIRAIQATGNQNKIVQRVKKIIKNESLRDRKNSNKTNKKILQSKVLLENYGGYHNKQVRDTEKQ